tara:strand:+ start:77 stop:586 length:510 start_codon:yes stop_codon:yes gene_type:complete
MNEDKINNLIEKIVIQIRKNRSFYIGMLILAIIITVGFNYYNYSQKNKNELISEKYILADIYFSMKDKEKSKQMYEEIISSDNIFYSLLSLNKIIDKNLEKNNTNVLKIFSNIEKKSMNKEQLNLVKLKKAVYLIKISKNSEGNILLNEIISNNSIWKDVAIELKESTK